MKWKKSFDLRSCSFILSFNTQDKKFAGRPNEIRYKSFVINQIFISLGLTVHDDRKPTINAEDPNDNNEIARSDGSVNIM